VLSPFDDAIHPSADPIAHPAPADLNHYDRYWSNGQQKEGRFYFAELRFDDPEQGEAPPELEKVFTFRMRGIGYWHPYWTHGSNHRVFETGRESVKLDEFDPLDMASLHIQNLVLAKMGGRTKVGVLDEIHLGPPEPTGLTGFVDCHQRS
jgi:hypothetical protein